MLATRSMAPFRYLLGARNGRLRASTAARSSDFFTISIQASTSTAVHGASLVRAGMISFKEWIDRGDRHRRHGDPDQRRGRHRDQFRQHQRRRRNIRRCGLARRWRCRRELFGRWDHQQCRDDLGCNTGIDMPFGFSGRNGFGHIYAGATGFVSHSSGATISGGSIGVYIPTGTVINDGTSSSGAGGIAVQFCSNSANRLIVGQGAVFIGTGSFHLSSDGGSGLLITHS